MTIPVTDPPSAPEGDETTFAAVLAELRAGRREALDRLLPLVYHELRRVAHRQLRNRPNDTLSTTALVHEVYLKLAHHEGEADWRDRAHFLSVAAIAMRHILVDLARRRTSEKRGGSRKRVDFEEGLVGTLEDRSEALVDLDEALTDLAAVDERLARVVECRFFGGMTEQETAAAMGVTERTVRRDWTKARALLYEALGS
jgi:RNA polymerase sigma factor (TIGR02999 family)